MSWQQHTGRGGTPTSRAKFEAKGHAFLPAPAPYRSKIWELFDFHRKSCCWFRRAGWKPSQAKPYKPKNKRESVVDR